MSRQPSEPVTAPAPTFSISFNVPAPPAMSAPSGPAAVYTAAPPLSAVKHLLSDKPLARPRRCPPDDTPRAS